MEFALLLKIQLKTDIIDKLNVKIGENQVL